MIARTLADLVLVLHLAFILFAVAGGVLALRWRWVPFVQIPAASWGVLVEVSGMLCPLTPLENSLRRAAGSSGYTGGFVEQYLVPIVYPESLTQPSQLALAGVVLVTNGLVYAAVYRRRRAQRSAVAKRGTAAGPTDLRSG